MKLANLLGLIVGVTGGYLRGAEAIQAFTLDDRVVRHIGVSRGHVTTITFPGPLQAIDAAYVTTDPQKPGYFQLAYKPGTAFFSVQALAERREVNVNVVYHGRTYVLRLFETNQPTLAVQFTHPTAPVISPPAGPLAPTRLLGLLQTAKAYPLLARQHPAAVRQVKVVTPHRMMDYGDFTLHLAAVYRFEAEDALVFHLQLTNRTDQEICYLPNSLAIRVGERQFSAALADASGSVPPRGGTEAYFVVAGTPDGGRNDLSAKNTFTVLLTRTKPR